MGLPKMGPEKSSFVRSFVNDYVLNILTDIFCVINACEVLE